MPRERRRAVQAPRFRRQPRRARDVRHRARGAREARSRALRARLSIVQQARDEDIARVSETYKARIGVNAEVAPFFRDLPERMAAAHLVIARSGGSTVAELAAIGRPAILVPLPHAHRSGSACQCQRAGGRRRRHADHSGFFQARAARQGTHRSFTSPSARCSQTWRTPRARSARSTPPNASPISSSASARKERAHERRRPAFPCPSGRSISSASAASA